MRFQIAAVLLAGLALGACTGPQGNPNGQPYASDPSGPIAMAPQALGTVAYADQPFYNAMDNLLNTWGYFVEVNCDQDPSKRHYSIKHVGLMLRPILWNGPTHPDYSRQSKRPPTADVSSRKVRASRSEIDTVSEPRGL